MQLPPPPGLAPRRVAGSRLHFSLAGSWCLPGRNGRNVPLSRACCAVYKAVFSCLLWKVLQLQSLLSPMNILTARPLENKVKFHLFVLLALLKTKRCQAFLALLGVFQQSLCLIETGPITLDCSPEEGAAGRYASPKAERTALMQGGHLCL